MEKSNVSGVGANKRRMSESTGRLDKRGAPVRAQAQDGNTRGHNYSTTRTRWTKRSGRGPQQRNQH